MRLRPIVALFGASVALLVPAGASSSTPATYDEQIAMERFLPEHIDCYSIRLSSGDPSWAAARPRQGAPGCSRGDRPTIVLFADEIGWHVDPANRRLPPDPKSSCQYFTGHGGTIPAEPALDLGLCTPPVAQESVTIECRNGRFGTKSKKRGSVRRPTRCNTLTSTQSFSEAVDLVGLRWNSWDGRKATAELMGYARTLGRKLGLEAWQFPALGGQGLIYGTTHISRLATDLFPMDPDPDFVLCQGSINDALGSYDGTVGPAMGALVDAVQAEYPKAAVASCGPIFAANPSGTSQIISNQIAAWMAANRPEVPHINSMVVGSPWLTGTGKVGGTTGDGTGDYTRDADANHPTQVGHDIIAARMADALRSAWGLA